MQGGEDVDAVNLSQQNFTGSLQTTRVQDLIRQLTSLEVGVLVAAGNGGPNQTNQFAGPGAFAVESTSKGVRNADSGLGNVQGESISTSFATATLSPRIAELLNSGMSIQQILALM